MEKEYILADLLLSFGININYFRIFNCPTLTTYSIIKKIENDKQSLYNTLSYTEHLQNDLLRHFLKMFYKHKNKNIALVDLLLVFGFNCSSISKILEKRKSNIYYIKSKIKKDSESLFNNLPEIPESLKNDIRCKFSDYLKINIYTKTD
jgi:hypothetical protein